MNERDIELAKQVYGTAATKQELQFAALVRADEREACAKVCDEVAETHGDADECATEIRAKGNT